ncbi:hypothetical protein [Hymenobacter psychrotolerans]|uniref:Uncharacterized protein n=1 Tax=Hymenobacter psychrotolerans DSM 18569 TaxID=1121959 RepID=A0A1M7G0R2_9BACT|nr:hypothetical protein [Hymenobacter psychrotolerans]SHM09952.1 hypothetical protein SAMN02746009_03938 [Hymenobacter psychrotolerans DSM 18569]
MLWLLLFLLMAALGVLWWRFAMPASAGAAVVPPPLEGNHPSLRTRHYRLADFHPAPLVAPPAAGPSSEEDVATEKEDVAPESPAEAVEPTAETAAEKAPQAPAPSGAEEATPEAGRLPEGARHNYLTAPAHTATDEHNRGVELTAAERRAKMRALMNEALDNRRAAPATV